MDIAAMGRQFGLDPQQTQAAFEALAPVVAAGMRRNAGNQGGLADLIGALSGGGLSRYAEDSSALGSPQAVDDGNAVLGRIFSTKDVSRGVAQQISANTGIGADILKKMLPIIAAMIMGQLAKSASAGSASSGGGLGEILGQVIGGGQSGGGGWGDILGQVLGGGGSQGNAADDLLKSVSEALGRR